MKKTLAALAVLGAFAGSAMAADVTLYGVVDLGLKYTNVDNDNGTSDVDKLEMATGMQSGSRFGLKGVEDLGNGMKVGFVLENGFDGDTGDINNGGRMFGRESQLFINGSFGELSFGRVGQLTSGNGTYGIAGSMTPFGTSWGGAIESSYYMVGFQRFDNTVTYKSPTFAGVTVFAQYSFDGNTKDKWTSSEDADGNGADKSFSGSEGHGTATRYASLGATYAAGGLSLVGTVVWYNWSSNLNRFLGEGEDGSWDHDYDLKDGFAVTLGGSYDFQVVKAYLAAQYFDNMWMSSSNAKESMDFAKVGVGIDGPMKGYAVTAGVDAPIWGGTAMFAAGYTSTEADWDLDPADKKAESDRWGVGIGYNYPLSKRTNVYAVAGYYQDKITNEDCVPGEDRDPSTTTVMLGMRHRF